MKKPKAKGGDNLPRTFPHLLHPALCSISVSPDFVDVHAEPLLRYVELVAAGHRLGETKGLGRLCWRTRAAATAKLNEDDGVTMAENLGFELALR